MPASLILQQRQEWPRLAGWLAPGENCTALGYEVVRRAMLDVGIVETPLGSNRGIRIDRYTRRAGIEPPQWWCAIWVGAVFADCGAAIPREYAACDRWLPFMRPDPAIGAAVLYGVPGDARHIGIVARLDPLVLTIEGNRSFAGAPTNNGIGVDIGPMN